jgi:rsbT antagonist protein RsbS
MPGAEGVTPQEPLSVSILRRNGRLVASIRTARDDGQLACFGEDLLERIGRERAGGVIIDVAALDVIDSFCHTMRMIPWVARLRGATTVVIGIQPGVALAMARLGTSLHAVPTALDLQGGLACLDGASIAGGQR